MRRVKRILTEDEWLDGVTWHIRNYLYSIKDSDWEKLEYSDCSFCVAFKEEHWRCPVEKECGKYLDVERFQNASTELFALQVYWEYRERFMEAKP